MKKFSAVVKDSYSNRIVFIENQEYTTKKDFINDLRNNGYKVNPKKVKSSELFRYIVENTNMYDWDWDLKEIPHEQ